ncbi:MAG TPA: MmgE/PrpD family protein [Arsenicitalea sp.]|jgi:2-methylcitrate dehydratase PrpD|nr:MmgE/PrpD family protein [Arsenicitalea sp.]
MATSELVANCLNTKFEDIPAEVVNHAKLCLLNWASVAVGGSRHKAVEILLRTAGDLRVDQQATILGRTEKTDLMWATLINGTSSHVHDFDDTHLETLNHPGSAIAPVCFALAERLNLSGRELLRAFIIGMEANMRIGNAVSPSHYDVGWHITSTAGVFGAAIAAGLLLEIDSGQMVYALGLAATQASGLLEMLGTMTKLMHAGKAAQNGLLAAMLAGQGMDSSLRPLESPRGFAAVFAPQSDLSKVNAGWGEDWELLKVAFKPYPCGIVLHPVIDACLALRAETKPENVKSIELVVCPHTLILTGKENPRTGLEAKYSVRHVAAMAFHFGEASVEQFTEEYLFSEPVRALTQKIIPKVDAAMGDDEVLARLTEIDGTVREVHIPHATGSKDNPMTAAQLTAKFNTLSRNILDAKVGLEFTQRLAKLEAETQVSALLQLTVPKLSA